MRLDSIALGLVIVLGICWLGVALTGLVAAWPYGLVGLAVLAVVGYLLVGVIRQRLNNAEDDYYEKNVDQ